MMIRQPLSGAMNANVDIRGVMGLNINRSLPLPFRGSIISFSGVLLAMEENVIQVAVERISYLPITIRSRDTF